MIDSRSLAELLPSVRQLAIHFLALGEIRLAEAYPDRILKVRVTSTYRDAEMQDSLYAKGRTAPGRKVTNARGGDSWHQYRCAWDVVVWVDGRITWEPEYYRLLGEVAKDMGLTWGGDWNGDGQQQSEDFDLVHFQWTGGLKLADLKLGTPIPEIT